MLMSIARRFGVLGERLVTRGNLGITLRAQVPDGGGILDQEREVVLIEQGKNARSVRADEIVHARIEAVVHVSEHQVQIGLGCADGFDLADPFLLLAAGEIGAVIEKGPQARFIGLSRLKELDRVEAVETAGTRREHPGSWA